MGYFGRGGRVHFKTLNLALPYSRVLINKCRRDDGHRKAPLGKHHHNDCCQQGPITDVKIGEQKNDEKQDTGVVSKCLPRRYLLIIKGKTVPVQ